MGLFNPVRACGLCRPRAQFPLCPLQCRDGVTRLCFYDSWLLLLTVVSTDTEKQDWGTLHLQQFRYCPELLFHTPAWINNIRWKAHRLRRWAVTESEGLPTRTELGLIPTLPLHSRRTLAELYHLSKFQLPRLENGVNNFRFSSLEWKIKWDHGFEVLSWQKKEGKRAKKERSINRRSCC